MKVMAIGILSIALFHGGVNALGQMTCSVIHPESGRLQAHSETSASRPLSAKDRLNGLIEERLSLMTAVARTKWNSGAAIEDPIREQQLLADVVVKAQTIGIPAEWAQHFFRLQMEAAKEVQYCLFAHWTAQHQGAFKEVQDLRAGIRPRLDQLTAELLQELAQQWPELRKSESPAKSEPLNEQSTNEIAIRLALLPLTDGSLQSSGRVGAVK
jgi:chorismate mutase